MPSIPPWLNPLRWAGQLVRYFKAVLRFFLAGPTWAYGLTYLLMWIAFAAMYLCLPPGSLVQNSIASEAERVAESELGVGAMWVAAVERRQDDDDPEGLEVVFEGYDQEANLLVVAIRSRYIPTQVQCLDPGSALYEGGTFVLAASSVPPGPCTVLGAPDPCYEERLGYRPQVDSERYFDVHRLEYSDHCQGNPQRLALGPTSVVTTEYHDLALYDESITFMNAVRDRDPTHYSGAWLRMIYFSAVTQTTLGFGDIVPVSNWARAYVTAQAMLGIVVIGMFLNSLRTSVRGRSNSGD